jgi:hypothetical protein
MYKTEESVKPLTGTVLQSSGNGFNVGNLDLQTLTTALLTILRHACFRPDPHGFGLFPDLSFTIANSNKGRNLHRSTRTRRFATHAIFKVQPNTG